MHNLNIIKLNITKLLVTLTLILGNNSAHATVDVSIYNSVGANSFLVIFPKNEQRYEWTNYCASDPYNLQVFTPACWSPGSDGRSQAATIRPSINYITNDDPLSKLTGVCTVVFQPHYSVNGNPVLYVSSMHDGWEAYPGGPYSFEFSKTYPDCQKIVGGGRFDFPYIKNYRFKSFPYNYSAPTKRELCYSMRIESKDGKEYDLIGDSCTPISGGDKPIITPASCTLDIPTTLEHGVINKNDLSKISVTGRITCSKSATVNLLFGGTFVNGAGGGAVYQFGDNGPKTSMCVQTKTGSCKGGSSPLTMSIMNGDILVTSTIDSSQSGSGDFSLSAPLIMSFQ